MKSGAMTHSQPNNRKEGERIFNLTSYLKMLRTLYLREVNRLGVGGFRGGVLAGKIFFLASPSGANLINILRS